jgi:TetR/AcrR family transcriptional regulator, transcriptional repressor for nem operon
MSPQPTLKEGSGSRAKLIQSTVELLASRGYENTSVQDIIDAAGVTKSNFYYHFKSKEELCLTALESMEGLYFEAVVEPILKDVSKSARKRFEALMNAMIHKMENMECSQGCPFSNLASELSDSFPEFRTRLTQFYQRKISAIEKCYKEGVAALEFRNDILSTTDAAQLILSTFNGSVALAKTYKNTEIIRTNMAHIMDLLSRSQNLKN